MYDENCKERWEHGQKPYKRLEDYTDRYHEWLLEKWQNRDFKDAD